MLPTKLFRPGFTWKKDFLIPLYGLGKKETMRFIKFYHQCIFAPVINGLVMMVIFYFAFGSMQEDGVRPINFIVPGVIMMSVIQNAFANSSSSIVAAKVIGYLYDYIMPPLHKTVFMLSLCGASILRVTLISLCLMVVVYFYDVRIMYPGYALLVIFISGIFNALLGIITGVVARTFDQMGAITMYVITPLSLLSGTFYSIDKLPNFFRTITFLNPFYYMIEGMRYAFTGKTIYQPNLILLILGMVTFVLYMITSSLLGSKKILRR